MNSLNTIVIDNINAEVSHWKKKYEDERTAHAYTQFRLARLEKQLAAASENIVISDVADNDGC